MGGAYGARPAFRPESQQPASLQIPIRKAKAPLRGKYSGRHKAGRKAGQQARGKGAAAESSRYAPERSCGVQSAVQSKSGSAGAPPLLGRLRRPSPGPGGLSGRGMIGPEHETGAGPGLQQGAVRDWPFPSAPYCGRSCRVPDERSDNRLRKNKNNSIILNVMILS